MPKIHEITHLPILSHLKLLESQGYVTSLTAHGFKKQDLQMLNSESIWTIGDRALCRSYLDTIIFSTLDGVGLQRITVPVEYIALCVVVFVKPVNWMICSSIMNTPTNSLEDMLEEKELTLGTATADLIFANTLAISEEIHRMGGRGKLITKIVDALELGLVSL